MTCSKKNIRNMLADTAFSGTH